MLQKKKESRQVVRKSLPRNTDPCEVFSVQYKQGMMNLFPTKSESHCTHLWSGPHLIKQLSGLKPFLGWFLLPPSTLGQ